MPRGVKKKPFVGRATGDDTHGNIVKQFYINNHRINLEKFKGGALKKYDPRTRTRVEIKIKEEKNS